MCSGPADPQAADQDRLRELEERVVRLERDLGRLDRDMFLLKVSGEPAGRLD